MLYAWKVFNLQLVVYGKKEIAVCAYKNSQHPDSKQQEIALRHVKVVVTTVETVEKITAIKMFTITCWTPIHNLCAACVAANSFSLNSFI